MNGIFMGEPSDSNKSMLQGRWAGLRARIWKTFPFLSGVMAAFLAFFLYNFLFPANQVSEVEVSNAIASALASATPRPAFSVQVYQTIQPSLVMIESEFESANAEAQKGLGSGVIVDNAGDILTSLHVVDGARKITITFADGTRSEADVVSAQPENDIAVLRTVTMPEMWMPATLGSAGSVGDEAYVVGNPFGLYNSLSAGVISGFNRTFQPSTSSHRIEGLIQFDAAANPGNSGGPLLNRYGHVIGIVTGIINPTDQKFFVGIGFAVPIATAAGGIGSPPY
jgi:S1-C subfamily serine protease